MSTRAEATTSIFNDLAVRPNGLVIVDFFTPDCIPCRKLEPMLAAAVRTVGDRLRVIRVNAAATRDVAERFGVQGVPTLLLLRDGTEIDRRIGFQTAHQLREWVESHLS